MAQTIATSLEKLNTALEGDKTALTAKKVSVLETTKHSDIPSLIEGIKNNPTAKISVTCDKDYNGTNLTFTNGSDKVIGKISNNLCEVEVFKTGTWTITNTIDKQSITVSVKANDYTATLKAIPKSVAMCSITKFNSTYGALLSDYSWYNHYNRYLIFTDTKASDGATTKDVSSAGDKSVVVWIETPTTNTANIYVSTQIEGVKVKLPSDLEGFASYQYQYEDYDDFTKTNKTYKAKTYFKSIDLRNVDYSGVRYTDYSFCREITSYITDWQNNKQYTEQHLGPNCDEIICNDDWTTNSYIKNSTKMFAKNMQSTKVLTDYVGGTYAKPKSMGGYFTEK